MFKRKSDSGITAIEYSLLAVLIATAIIISVMSLRTSVTGVYNHVVGAMPK